MYSLTIEESIEESIESSIELHSFAAKGFTALDAV
jgi:hypothetical protein